MKRCLLCILLFVFTLCACDGDNDLADCFNEETVKTEAQKAIENFVNKDYENIRSAGNQVFIDSLSPEQWAQTCDPYVDDAGTFEKIDSLIIAGQKGNDGNDYAVVIAVGQFSNDKIQFTIVFDTDMKLAQFFIK